MAIFTKNSGVKGAWVDKKALNNGDVVKLVSEAMEQPSQQGGTQIVAKLRVKGDTGEAKNVSINTPTKNALIEAFGEDSKNWINQLLTVHTEKTMIAGKRGIALYLIPAGYEVTEDEGGYVVVAKIKEGQTTGTVNSPTPTVDTIEYPEEDINPEDIPF